MPQPLIITARISSTVTWVASSPGKTAVDNACEVLAQGARADRVLSLDGRKVGHVCLVKRKLKVLPSKGETLMSLVGTHCPVL